MAKRVAIGLCAGALAMALMLSACGKSDPAPAAEVAKTPGVISFPANAPELDSLQIVSADDGSVPISADLNARVAVDESVTSRVGSPIAGRVTRIVADLGQSVKAGQPLAYLDAPDLAQARADMAKAEADNRLKARALDRAKVLFGGDAIPKRDVEAAEADAAGSAAELQRARLRAANLGPGQGSALALTSSVPGYVIDRQLNPGQQIAAGQGPLFTVTDPRRLWLYVDVPETSVGRARIGEPVDFDVPAYPGRRFTGTISEIGVGVDPATRRVQLRARVANPDMALKPEMYARARLVSDDGARAIRVPNAALFEQGMQTYLFKQEAPGRFRRVPVSVGERGDAFSYVTSGLKAGDKIVGEGALLLNAQMAGD